MGAEKTLVDVSKGQNPYNIIGNYILNHVAVVEDMIAVIQINGEITNELYMVDTDTDPVSCFYWLNDWWEGEENVALLDFFPVRDAGRAGVCNIQKGDVIYRQSAIDVFDKQFWSLLDIPICKEIRRAAKDTIKALPSAETEPHCIPCSDSDRLPEDDLISRQAATIALRNELKRNTVTAIRAMRVIAELPSAQPEIVRCKDCVYFPEGTGEGHDLKFPGGEFKCPCECDDYWYSWKPADDWFCGNGKRKENES